MSLLLWCWFRPKKGSIDQQWPVLTTLRVLTRPALTGFSRRLKPGAVLTGQPWVDPVSGDTTRGLEQLTKTQRDLLPNHSITTTWRKIQNLYYLNSSSLMPRSLHIHPSPQNHRSPKYFHNVFIFSEGSNGQPECRMLRLFQAFHSCWQNKSTLCSRENMSGLRQNYRHYIPAWGININKKQCFVLWNDFVNEIYWSPCKNLKHKKWAIIGKYCLQAQTWV